MDREKWRSIIGAVKAGTRLKNQKKKKKDIPHCYKNIHCST
jgi:hypothetical protein